jgi:hypothetical protein
MLKLCGLALRFYHEWGGFVPVSTMILYERMAKRKNANHSTMVCVAVLGSA